MEREREREREDEMTKFGVYVPNNATSGMNNFLIYLTNKGEQITEKSLFQ